MKSCFLVKRRIVVTYVYPVLGLKYDKNADRFTQKMKQFRPTLDFHIFAVANGANPNDRMKAKFEGLPVSWGVHNNAGFDIGAYQHAARSQPCDLMVFFGSSGYPRQSGWLEKMVDSEARHGLGLYGTMGNMGDPGVGVYPHIRTTGFMMRPELLNAYPYPVVAPNQRYPFEHGDHCLTEFCKALGLPRIVVAKCGEYDYPLWDSFPNGFYRGDQSNLLTGDRLTDPPFYPPNS